MRALKSLTFLYVPREDRMLAAVNAGSVDAWSCWLTRRLALAVLERATDYLQKKSDLTQRTPANLRGELIAFERDAAIAKTARAMSVTPPAVLKTSEVTAELAQRLTISQVGGGFRLELHGPAGTGAAAVLKPAELQRVLQMLRAEVTKAGWGAASSKTEAATAPRVSDPKPVPH